MPGREKIETSDRAMRKIENLNAIVPRTTKLTPKGRITPDIRLHSAMKADYSWIHKENVILEENLEGHLLYIKKNERRAMEEKGEELDEMRRQMDVISKLQEAVNSRTQANTVDILAANKMVRFGQQWMNDNKKSRAQMKIEAEREKFSSRNLFNVRRFHAGFDFLQSRKRIPSSAMQIPSDIEGDNAEFLKNESPKPQKPQQTKGYLKQTFSSTSGLRPMTATVTYQREQKEDDILPPRSKSAILRSRSRRQLELLCRVTPKEDELEITADFQIDWKVVNERRRRRRLQQLQVENEEIKGKVSHFLMGVDQFNKRPISGTSNNVKVSKEDAIWAKLLQMQEMISIAKSGAAEQESESHLKGIQDIGTEIHEFDNTAGSTEVSFRNTNSPGRDNVFDVLGMS